MAVSGGRMPFDQAGALTGPARVVYAPMTVAVPDDLWDIIPPVKDVNGEYPCETGWLDFGLAADAPVYTHSKDTEGIAYQQSAGDLFTQISSIARSFKAQIAQIDPANMKIVENTATSDAVAAAAGKSALTKVPFGIYQSFRQYRIACISYRPDGSADVTEPDGEVRPPAVALVLPTVVLAAEDSEFEFDAGNPVNAEVSFTALRTAGMDAGEEHGYWVFETPGTIAP